MVKELFAQHLNVDLGAFPRMTWHEAMERFGSDKPIYASILSLFLLTI